MTDTLDWFARDREGLAAAVVTDYSGDPARRTKPVKKMSTIDLMLALAGMVARRQRAGDEILGEPVEVRLEAWSGTAKIVVGGEVVATVPVV